LRLIADIPWARLSSAQRDVLRKSVTRPGGSAYSIADRFAEVRSASDHGDKSEDDKNAEVDLELLKVLVAWRNLTVHDGLNASGELRLPDGCAETLLNAQDSLTDWQKMWILAALMQKKPANETPIKVALKILKDATRHDALRAVAAIYVGRFGDHARRKNLFSLYPSVSSYIQAAIYFSSRTWPAVERSNAKASWGAHGELNALLTAAMNKPIKKIAVGK
jgi:hypothetical protein